MAIASTGFNDAVDDRVVQATAISNTTALTNIAGTSGYLSSVIIESTNSTDNVSIHIYDSSVTSVTQIGFKGKASSTKVYDLTTRFQYTELSFWVSKLTGESDTTSFAGNVDVTFVTSRT
jgi:hydroxyethylthiazole kinase-like sugar kinase family protein